jgi:hypothetical protein
LLDGGPADRGAVEEMEVGWPSGIALRGEVLNRPHLHWLKTVVENKTTDGISERFASGGVQSVAPQAAA